MSRVFKVVLSGGPCGGKSTSMSKIEQTLTARGYKVLIVPETATELIINGVIPGNKLSLEKFQEFVLDKQLSKECLYDEIAKNYDSDKVVILFDRGIPDQLAYISKEQFEDMLYKRNLTLSNVTDRYDLVLHLVSAAKGAESEYEWIGKEHCNNKARSESPEEARKKDDLTLNGWMSAGCKKLKVIDNSTNFDEKINRVIETVFKLIGEPVPSSVEKKFLVRKPSDELLKNIGFSSRNEIIQTYLRTNIEGIERKVRQIGNEKDGYSFYYTQKTKKNGINTKEIEKKISVKDYINLMSEADTSLHQLKKERYCFISNNQFFELDVYPFDSEYAILDLEIDNKEDSFLVPNFLEVIKDVTNDDYYKNIRIAKDLSL